MWWAYGVENWTPTERQRGVELDNNNEEDNRGERSGTIWRR
jgi:hypothetical protein